MTHVSKRNPETQKLLKKKKTGVLEEYGFLFLLWKTVSVRVGTPKVIMLK